MKPTLFLFLLFCTFNSIYAQQQSEREHRIRKAQFPNSALQFIEDKVDDFRRIRFYKEIDSFQVSYIAKFKKDRLRYRMQFATDATLKSIALQLKPVDIPESALANMNRYFTKEFTKYRVQKMFQQYLAIEDDLESTLRNAFKI